MSSRQKTLKAQVEQASFEYGARIAWLEQEQPARLFGVRHVGRSGEILVLVQTLLIEQGLASFSMRSVASGIGMTLAALQYHFPTKDDLVRAMINHKVQYNLDGFDAILGTLTDDPETILLSGRERRCRRRRNGNLPRAVGWMARITHEAKSWPPMAQCWPITGRGHSRTGTAWPMDICGPRPCGIIRQTGSVYTT
jgi:Bacterial regulatory proteins, tetR family